jgi:uncharacterized protein (TIGR03792 family)
VVIEWLTFQVPIDWRDRYIQADAAIWTTFLAACPGFISKQVWQNPDRPDQISLVVEWETREQWKAIDPVALAAVDRQFVAAVGRSFELIAAREYYQLAPDLGHPRQQLSPVGQNKD